MAEARELFGRNALAKRLGVKAAKMVSKSAPWLSLAEELGLPHGKRVAAATRPTKIAMTVAEEVAGDDAGDTTAADVERRETWGMIKKAIANATGTDRKAPETLADEFERGHRNDNEARQVLALYAEQKQEHRARKVSGRL